MENDPIFLNTFSHLMGNFVFKPFANTGLPPWEETERWILFMSNFLPRAGGKVQCAKVTYSGEIDPSTLLSWRKVLVRRSQLSIFLTSFFKIKNSQNSHLLTVFEGLYNGRENLAFRLFPNERAYLSTFQLVTVSTWSFPINYGSIQIN